MDNFVWFILAIIAFSVASFVVLLEGINYLANEEFHDNKDLILEGSCEYLQYKLTIYHYSFLKTEDFAKKEYQSRCIDIEDMK